jgi:hypothetical protein
MYGLQVLQIHPALRKINSCSVHVSVAIQLLDMRLKTDDLYLNRARTIHERLSTSDREVYRVESCSPWLIAVSAFIALTS